MSSEEALLVSGAVVALTQFAKWAGIDDRRGPLAAIVLSLLGVLLWAVSTVPEWGRALVWSIFTGWVNVLLASAGVYGYTRALPQAVTSFTKPPGEGAGSSSTGATDADAMVDLVAQAIDRREVIRRSHERRERAAERVPFEDREGRVS